MRQVGQIVEQLCGAGDRDDAVGLRRLGGEQHAVLGEVLVVRAVGQQQRHRVLPLTPVDDREGLRRIDAVRERPLGPQPLDDGVRVDEGAVHVEQQRRRVGRDGRGVGLAGGRGVGGRDDGCRDVQPRPAAPQRRDVPPGAERAVGLAHDDRPVRGGRVDHVHEHRAVVAGLSARREGEAVGRRRVHNLGDSGPVGRFGVF